MPGLAPRVQPGYTEDMGPGTQPSAEPQNSPAPLACAGVTEKSVTLRDKLAGGKFVITAEVTPPLSASADVLMARVEPLAGLVDALNVTDAPGARATMSSFAAAAIVARQGIEPVLQITCRDRNRIALASDLIGAAAQGIENLLILHGDDPATGDMPDAKPVYDLDSRELMALANNMSDHGLLPSGRSIEPPPRFFIGCADTALDPPAEWVPNGLEAKIAAGARFVQMQFCFDPDLLQRYFARLKEAGITEQLDLIIGIGPLLSAKQARFMQDNLFGVSIPKSVVERLERASDERAEGLVICAELIAELSAIDGAAGVHVMAPAQSPQAIVDVIQASGLR
jgi:methylenetetrahydrofolate reductase (NADPH)